MKSKLASRPCLALLLVFLAGVVPAQEIRLSTRPNPLVDRGRLARIDDLMNAYVRSNWIKGVVTIVVKDGQVVQYKGYGWADAEAQKPMPNNALFRIASQRHHLLGRPEGASGLPDHDPANSQPPWRPGKEI